MKPECRPACQEDVEAFYGPHLALTMRAWVWTLEGKPIGLAGVVYHGDGQVPMIFSKLRPEARRFPRTIVDGARAMLREMARQPMYAIADSDTPTAPRFLAHLGFEFVRPSLIGDLYRFVP